MGIEVRSGGDGECAMSNIMRKSVYRGSGQITKNDCNLNGGGSISAMEIFLSKGCNVSRVACLLEKYVEGRQNGRFSCAIRPDQARVIVKMYGCIFIPAKIADLYRSNFQRSPPRRFLTNSWSAYSPETRASWSFHEIFAR